MRRYAIAMLRVSHCRLADAHTQHLTPSCACVRARARAVTQVPHALNFTKLRCMPDQMYVSVKGVRTTDDAQITVHLMLFYELKHIEAMLDATNDPIGDFINAVSADVMTFGSANTYESLMAATAALSDLESFPILAGRMQQTGFELLKIVYRGYSASGTLQSMHDQ